MPAWPSLKGVLQLLLAQPWCPKEVTAGTGEETLNLKNPKFWLLQSDKNHHWAICCSGEQLLSSHSPSEEEKRVLFWEKDLFSVSPSPQAHTNTQLLGYGCSASTAILWAWTGALGNELSSTPAAAYLQSKAPSGSSPDHHRALPCKHMQWLSGDYHLPPRAMSSSEGFLVPAWLRAPRMWDPSSEMKHCLSNIISLLFSSLMNATMTAQLW